MVYWSKGVDAYREYFIDLSLSHIPLTIPNNPRSGLIDGVGVHHEANDNNYNLFNGSIITIIILIILEI